MRSPFFSEGEGFEFVLVTLAAFTVIAVASLLGGPWVAVSVWGVLTAAVLFFYIRRGRARPRIRTAPPHVGAKDERRILVLALAALDDDVLDVIGRAAEGPRAQVLVVAPAQVATLDRWMSHVDAGRARAQRVLDDSVARLRERGIDARSQLGDEDPLQAIEDALRSFGGDEIVVSIGADGDGNLAARRTRGRFALPVTEAGGQPRSTV